MRVYVDSSALLKRVLVENESTDLVAALRAYVDDGAAVLASSLAWIEVSRAVRTYANRSPSIDVDHLVEVALSGVHERPMSPDVVALARRLQPPVLRTLDAIHLSSALLLDADVLVAYDARLADAARHNDLAVSSPGR